MNRSSEPLERQPAAWRRLLGDRRGVWLGLLVLAAVARLPRLGESLWYDEAYYSTHERFATWRALFASLDTSIAAPVYRLLLFGWVDLFGENEVVVRLPSLLFGLGSIVLTYELARRSADESVARLAGVWLCLSPAHVWYSQEATPYAMVACLVLAAAVLAFRYADLGRADGRLLALYLVALAGAAFSHYYAVVVLLPLTLVAWSSPPPARRGLMAANVLVATGFLALLAVKWSSGGLRTGQGFLRPFTALEAWQLNGHWFLHGNCLGRLRAYRASLEALLAHPALLALQAAAATLVAFGIWRAVRGRPAARGWAMVAFLVTLPLALWALTRLGMRQLYIERYVFWVLPFHAFFLARGALAFGGRRAGRVAAALLLTLGVAAYAGWYREDDRWTVYKQNPDWRSAAADLAARTRSPARALAYGVTPALALEFHVRRIGAQQRVLVRDGGGIKVARLTRRGIGTVYLVENLYWRGSFGNHLAALDAHPRLHRVAVHRHRGVNLYEFELRARGVDRAPDESAQPTPVDPPPG